MTLEIVEKALFTAENISTSSLPPDRLTYDVSHIQLLSFEYALSYMFKDVIGYLKGRWYPAGSVSIMLSRKLHPQPKLFPLPVYRRTDV